MEKNTLLLQEKLLRWYDHNRRELPWRKDKDPYRIWISEIMLQQTQVNTVIPYFNRWMKAFPSLQKLAAARQDQVLKAWEGLGYYSRARNIHQAAQIILREWSGLFPRNTADILKLPGIGPYSAGAIASIAFDQPEPILDGNVIRLLTRLYGIRQNTLLPQTRTRLWEQSKALVPEKRAGDFNQALMEIGALVCTPRTPSCLVCPLEGHCHARNTESQDQYPVKTRTKYEKLAVVLGVIWKKGKILIQKRPAKGRMGGLWEFPGGKVESSESNEEALIRELKEELDIHVEPGYRYAPIPHAYTRFRVTLYPFNCKIKAGIPKALFAIELKWVLPDELSLFAFPSANKKLFPHLVRPSKKENVRLKK